MSDSSTGIDPTAVDDAARYLDGWVAFRQRHDRIPGLQVALLHEDRLVLSTAHGHADVEAARPLTTRSLFRIASHSKTFTATAVLQLAESERLRLDDRAGRWIAFLDGTPLAEVTVRELLSHAGGLVRDGWDGDFWQLFRPFPDADQLRAIALDRADVLPRNERFKYSNIGYSLLGLVIEAASGQPYGQYVSENVLAPLGLRDTGPELDPERADEYATGYTALAYGDVRVPIEHVDTAAMAAATGFYSTAADVVRYAAAHFHGDERILTDSSKRVMQQTQWSVPGTTTGYALGLAVAEVGSRRVLGHGGGYPGHITRTMFDPVERLAVSVLTSAIDGPALTLATAVLRLVDLAAGASDRCAPADDWRGNRSAFCGRFANLWGVFDVVDLGGRLYQLDPTADDPAAEPTVLEVLDADTLRVCRGTGYGSHGESIRYERADDGSPVSLRGGSGATAYPVEDVRAAMAQRRGVTRGSPLKPG